MHVTRFVLALVATGLLSGPLLANDTTATIAGGVITYALTDQISMDSEVLEISADNIKVDYAFTNHSPKDIETDVAFPLPPSPVTLFDRARAWPSWDETYHAHRYLEDVNSQEQSHVTPLRASVSGAAFTNFTRTSEGQTYGASVQVKAIDRNGKDITSLLKKHKIPLSSLYLGGFMEEPALHRDAALKKKLAGLKLLGEGDTPLWQTYITYYWRQIFPANKTIQVTHAYRPSAGYQWVSYTPKKPGQDVSLDDIVIHHRDTDASGNPEKKKLTDYAISGEDKAALLVMFGRDAAAKENEENSAHPITYGMREVRYILTTGAHWKGPITSFRLEVTPPTKDTLVLTSFDGVLNKGSDGVYRFEAKNFTPTKDLKVLFIDRARF
ncbi:MAG: DUF4424 domain-containing protein [Proteobacteria bacterium]|nr:DUF4424 domain-containing protein [Pseudomonadota bacterium]